MQLHPIGTRVLIQLDEKKERAAGGIIIPDIATIDPFVKGTIQDYGQDVKTIGLDPGKRVLVPKSIASNSELDKEARQILVEEKEILGILSDGEEDETPAE